MSQVLITQHGLDRLPIGAELLIRCGSRQQSAVHRSVSRHNSRTQSASRLICRSVCGGVLVSHVVPVTIHDSDDWQVGVSRPIEGDAGQLRAAVVRANGIARQTGQRYRFRLVKVDGQQHVLKGLLQVRFRRVRSEQYLRIVQALRALGPGEQVSVSGVIDRDVRAVRSNYHSRHRFSATQQGDGVFLLRRVDR